MLPPLKLFALKLAVFSSVLLYLAIDLMLWQGPVWSLMHRSAEEKVDESQYVATVFGRVIDEERLAVYCQELAYLSGQSDPQSQKRASVLMSLIRAELIRVRAQYNDKNLPDTRAEAEAQYASLFDQAESSEIFAKHLQEAGLSEASLIALLEIRLKELAQLNRAIAPLCLVSDEELRSAYQAMGDELKQDPMAPMPPFEECSESLRTGLESAKRQLAVSAYFDASIREAFQTKQIKIYER